MANLKDMIIIREIVGLLSELSDSNDLWEGEREIIENAAAMLNRIEVDE